MTRGESTQIPDELRKLAIIRDTYTALYEEASSRRAELLEVAIVMGGFSRSACTQRRSHLALASGQTALDSA